MLKTILFTAVVFAFWSCEKKLLDIEQVVDKTPEEVETILGKPDTAYTQMIVTKPIYTQIFRDEVDIEIMYPDGLSTDIVVLDAAPEFKFNERIIARFGLKEIPPSHVQKNSFIKWKNYPGYKTINIFATDLDTAGNVEQFRIFFKSDGRTDTESISANQ